MTGTDWTAYNLPAIWQMLLGENVCAGADRVLAWDGLATSVREQHRRLLRAADDLAAVWPPENNESAYAFQAKIGELAASMQETLVCAEDTRAGLRGIMEALGDAQSTVRTLAAGWAQVSTDWVPRFIDHAEDEYDVRAQQAMRAAEAAIADHGRQIKAPTLYVMRAGKSESTTSLPDDGGSSAGGSSSTTLAANPVPVPVPHDPVLPDQGTRPDPNGSPASGAERGSVHDPSSLGSGPELSGVTAPPIGPAPGPGATAGLPTGPGGGAGQPGGVTGMPGPLGLVPGAGTVGGFGVPGGRIYAPGGRQAVPMRRGLPSGAVIGEGELRGGRGQGQVPLGAQGNRRGRRKAAPDPLIDAEADEQWETLDGVKPVIVPDSTPVRHDPGPGVLGCDR